MIGLARNALRGEHYMRRDASVFDRKVALKSASIGDETVRIVDEAEEHLASRMRGIALDVHHAFVADLLVCEASARLLGLDDELMKGGRRACDGVTGSEVESLRRFVTCATASIEGETSGSGQYSLTSSVGDARIDSALSSPWI